MKQRVTKTLIKEIIRQFIFDPTAILFRTAIANSSPEYCLIRAEEYLNEYKQTKKVESLHNVVQMITLSLAMETVNGANGVTKKAQRVRS